MTLCTDESKIQRSIRGPGFLAWLWDRGQSDSVLSSLKPLDISVPTELWEAEVRVPLASRDSR